MSRNISPKPKRNPKTGADMSTVVFEILKPILKAAKNKNVKLGGQLMVDHEKCGKFPLVFFVQPSGNHICWFIEGEEHKLYSLVNEKVRHVCTFPSDQTEAFEAKLKELRAELCE